MGSTQKHTEQHKKHRTPRRNIHFLCVFDIVNHLSFQVFSIGKIITDFSKKANHDRYTKQFHKDLVQRKL